MAESRADFDPKQAPKGWDYEKQGKPDILFWRYAGEEAAQAAKPTDVESLWKSNYEVAEEWRDTEIRKAEEENANKTVEAEQGVDNVPGDDIIGAENSTDNNGLSSYYIAQNSKTKTFEVLRREAETVDVSTQPNQAVFYSGRGNRERAEAFALENGKTTLEMTPGGRYFDDLVLFDEGSLLTGAQAYEIWSILSKRYAQSASGNVYGFVNGARPKSIFNTIEYPTFKKNNNITGIFTELFQ